MKKMFLVCIILVIAISGCSDVVSQESYTADNVEPSVEEQHLYVKKITAVATCEQEGEVVYTCETCGDTYTEKVVKLNHAGEETITVQPTFLENGEKKIVCSMCGGVFYKIVPQLGTLSFAPYEIDATALYADASNGNGEQYQDKYLLLSGIVVYLSDYGDLKGYYLYGSFGQGVVCWVNGTELVANTGSEVMFLGKVESVGTEQVELTNCSIINEVEVTDEPGLTKETAILVDINDISRTHTNKWILFSGEIIGTVPYGYAGTWYYLDGDVACLSSEKHDIGENVSWVGKMAVSGELWDTIVDCETAPSE